nr:hypothetical protein [Tanacetum cinerariifolium]
MIPFTIKNYYVIPLPSRTAMLSLYPEDLLYVAQVANAARNYEILHERDDVDTERPDKRQRSGDWHQPTSQQSSHRSHGNNALRRTLDRMCTDIRLASSASSARQRVSVVGILRVVHYGLYVIFFDDFMAIVYGGLSLFGTDFLNFLAEKDNFLLTVKENWYVKVKGFSMFILAKRLKNIKKVQQSLDKDPLNALLTEEKMVYSRVYRDAVIDEERLIKVEKLEEENMSLTKELKSFNTKVNSLVFKETVVDKEKSSKQRKKIVEIDADAEVDLENVYSLDMAHKETVLSMQDVIDADGKEVTQEMVEVKDKGKAKLVKEPEVLRSRKAQIVIDEEVVRRIEAEWNPNMKDNIDWNEVVEQCCSFVSSNEESSSKILKVIAK